MVFPKIPLANSAFLKVIQTGKQACCINCPCYQCEDQIIKNVS